MRRRPLKQSGRSLAAKLFHEDSRCFSNHSIDFSLVSHPDSIFRLTLRFLEMHSVSTSSRALRSAVFMCQVPGRTQSHQTAPLLPTMRTTATHSLRRSSRSSCEAEGGGHRPAAACGGCISQDDRRPASRQSQWRVGWHGHGCPTRPPSVLHFGGRSLRSSCPAASSPDWLLSECFGQAGCRSKHWPA